MINTQRLYSFQSIPPARRAVQARFGNNNAPDADAVGAQLVKSFNFLSHGGILITEVIPGAHVQLEIESDGRLMGTVLQGEVRIFHPETEEFASFRATENPKFELYAKTYIQIPPYKQSDPYYFYLLDAIQDDFIQKLKESKVDDIITIGRNPKSTIYIPSPSIGKTHCSITKTEDGIFELTSNSTETKNVDGIQYPMNETYLQIGPDTTEELNGTQMVVDGDKIHLGLPQDPRSITLSIPSV